MLKPVIFAGPSVYGLSGEMFDGLDRRPPAARGDLLKAAEEGRPAIGLIDGYFNSTRSVWHKEILFALKKGSRVFGAASMGALRAAECCDFGVIGVGRIFEDYASEKRQSDADVAVMHAPEELQFRPLTVALVDAEATILEGFEQGYIPQSTTERLLSASHSLHYAERTWSAVFKCCDFAKAEKEELERNLPAFSKSIKQEDAALLLSTIRCNVNSVPTEDGSNWKLQNTLYLRQMLKEFSLLD